MTTKSASTETSGRRKVREGRVVSDHMDKTVIVSVERRVQHRLYGKALRHSTKFIAHDEQNAYRVGDFVRIMETRPLSKTKRWRVTALLVRQELPDIEPAVAAEVQVDQATVAPRRRGPTRAARAAAARRAASGDAPAAVAPAEEASAPEEPETQEPEGEELEAEQPEATVEETTEEATEEPVAETDEPVAEVEETTEEPVTEAHEPEAAVEAAVEEAAAVEEPEEPVAEVEEPAADEPEATDEAHVEETHDATGEDAKEEKGS